MTARFRILMVALGALMALSAVGVGSAQALRPRQPQFTSSIKGVAGETIKGNITVEDQADRSRLWTTALGIVITCEKATSNGTIGPLGVDTGEVTYRECNLLSPRENNAKQFEEGELIGAKCIVKSEGAKNNGEIVTTGLTTRLVWGKKGTSYENEILDLYKPKQGGNVFVTIEITECSLLNGKYPVEGSVLAWIPRVNKNLGKAEEVTQAAQVFDVYNENKEVRQRFTEWEVENVLGGGLESGTAELSLKGTANKSAIESIVQFEQYKLPSTRRGLLGVRVG